MEKQKLRSELFNQSAITFATSIGIRIIRLIKNAIISRILGPSNRGIFGLLTIVPDFLASFGTLGYGQAILYYVAKKHYDVKKVMGGIIIFTTFISIIMISIGAISINLNLLSNDINLIIKKYQGVILMMVPFFLLQRFGISFLIALGMIFQMNLVELLGSFIALVLFLIIWIFWSQIAIKAAVWSWCLGIIIIACLPFFLIRKKGVYPPILGFDYIKKAFKYGISGHFTNFFQQLLCRIDFIFISNMLGAEALGYYAIATSLSEMILNLPVSVGVPLVPMIFGMDNKSSDKFTPGVIKVVIFFVTISSIILIMAGKIFIKIIFGPEYLPAYSAMVCLQPGMLALGLFPIIKADLFGRNLPGKVSIFTSIALIINLFMNYFTIPIWGISGAAISSSVSYFLSIGMMYILYCKKSNNPVLRTLILTKEDMNKLFDVLKSKIFRYYRKKFYLFF